MSRSLSVWPFNDYVIEGFGVSSFMEPCFQSINLLCWNCQNKCTETMSVQQKTNINLELYLFVFVAYNDILANSWKKNLTFRLKKSVSLNAIKVIQRLSEELHWDVINRMFFLGWLCLNSLSKLLSILFCKLCRKSNSSIHGNLWWYIVIEFTLSESHLLD